MRKLYFSITIFSVIFLLITILACDNNGTTLPPCSTPTVNVIFKAPFSTLPTYPGRITSPACPSPSTHPSAPHISLANSCASINTPSKSQAIFSYQFLACAYNNNVTYICPNGTGKLFGWFNNTLSAPLSLPNEADIFNVSRNEKIKVIVDYYEACTNCTQGQTNKRAHFQSESEFANFKNYVNGTVVPLSPFKFIDISNCQ